MSFSSLRGGRRSKERKRKKLEAQSAIGGKGKRRIANTPLFLSKPRKL